MKLSVPFYLVALGAGFLYAIVHYYVPTLPLTNDQVLWIVLTILAAFHVDVVQALRSRGTLR